MFGPGAIVANPADIEALREQLEASARDAQALAGEMSEEEGRWRPRPDAWSVSECLDHLATGNRVYLQAMRPSADRARARGAIRRRPARPGWIGGLFVRSLEPPPRHYKLKAPRKIRPRVAPALADAYAAFMISHADVRAFLMENADLDLAGIRFPNPFIRGIFFSLATSCPRGARAAASVAGLAGAARAVGTGFSLSVDLGIERVKPSVRRLP